MSEENQNKFIEADSLAVAIGCGVCRKLDKTVEYTFTGEQLVSFYVLAHYKQSDIKGAEGKIISTTQPK